MKKVFALMSIVAVFAMVSCGPSAKEKEEKEAKRIEDSLEQVRQADSVRQAMEAEMVAPVDTTVPADTTQK